MANFQDANPKLKKRSGRAKAKRRKDSAVGKKTAIIRPGPQQARQYTRADADLFLGELYRQARTDFGVFRRITRPDIFWNWWTDEVARELQQFADDLAAGRRPRVALMAPPQHGKTEAACDFTAWIAGNNPNLKIVYASYGDELGMVANRSFQRTLSSDPFSKIFPLQIGTPGWTANSNLIEFAGHSGWFRNTTVDGQLTGFGLDLGIIDDPFKGRAEANSKSIRDKTWSWFTDDFCSRLSKDAGLLFIMTRWHRDDLLGRLLAQSGQDLRVLRYPALAEHDENHWTSDWQLTTEGVWLPVWKHIRRSQGQGLLPQLKPESVLLEQRQLLSRSSWESQYQQNPITVDGGQLPIAQLKIINSFDRANILSSVRYWDKGSDGKDAAYTAGVLMHKMNDTTFVIEHVCRGRWSSLTREQRMREYAEADKKFCRNYMVVVEQEPGSAGKESAENTIRNLAGFRVYADRVTGSKQVRAEPFAAHVQAGNVFLRAGAWVEAFIDECETWPNGTYNDQVDAAAGAFNRLIKPYAYDSTYAGFN